MLKVVDVRLRKVVFSAKVLNEIIPVLGLIGTNSKYFISMRYGNSATPFMHKFT